MKGEITELDWNDVRGFVREPGAMLGAGCAFPTNLEKLAQNFIKHEIKALICIGGFEVKHLRFQPIHFLRNLGV